MRKRGIIVVVVAAGVFLPLFLLQVATLTYTTSETGRVAAFDDGRKIRTFAGTRGLSSQIYNSTSQTTSSFATCEEWGVVAASSLKPTVGVAMFVNSLPSWCLVVVPMEDQAEEEAAEEKYMAELKSNSAHRLGSVFYLSRKKTAGGPLDVFARSAPRTRAGRKNVGYLFAIANGARFVLDLEDDVCMLDIFRWGDATNVMEKTLSNVAVVMLGGNAFNPHPIMGLPGSRPRGFPVSSAEDAAAGDEIADVAYTTHLDLSGRDNDIGVVHFLISGDPDVDASLRKTRSNSSKSFISGHSSALVPVHAFAPYNSQSTLHARSAFWAMLLPASVPDGAADVWRSYLAQCLFADAGLRLIVAPPAFARRGADRAGGADVPDAERVLRRRAGPLIARLSEWDSGGDAVPQRMEGLWIDMYERGYVELDDVRAVQLWLGALVQAGYEFPPLKRRRHRNVAVFGQFNDAKRDMDFSFHGYTNNDNKDSTVRDVTWWVQKTKEYFHTVIAAGAFTDSQVREFERKSIRILRTDYDERDGNMGWYSPYGNMKDMLLAFKNSSKIEGVIYVHDDGFLNVTELTQGSYPFPTDKIIADLPVNTSITSTSYSYYIFPDGHIELWDRSASFNSTVAMNDTAGFIDPWRFFNTDQCLGAQIQMAKDSASAKYRESDGSIFFPKHICTDYMFVPTLYADAFAEVAELHLKYSTFLECAFPKIIHVLRRLGLKARNASVCTDWNFNTSRGTPESIIHNCIDSPPTWGFVHPLYRSRGSYKIFSELYDRIQYHEQHEN